MAEFYALQTISHGVKDGDGVKRVEYAPGEAIEEKDGVKPTSVEIKEWVGRGLASRRRPAVDEDAETSINEIDTSGEKRGGGVKTTSGKAKDGKEPAATKTDPPKDPNVVKNPPGTPSEPAGGAQP